MAEKEQLENIKRILKSTKVNFLLGAGTSYNEMLGKENYPLMSHLREYIRSCKTITDFQNEIITSTSIDSGTKKLIVNILNKYLLEKDANVESFLSVIEGLDFYIIDDIEKKIVQEFQRNIKMELRERLRKSDDDTVIDIYKDFYNGIRHLEEVNSERDQTINVFTTNYDMLNEKAMEELQIHYYSGFDGIVKRKFNLAYYNCNYTNNFSIQKNQFQINANHVNLYKIHGSISWEFVDNELIEKNPYNLNFVPEIIYPSVDKFSNTNLIINFSALMREMSSQLCKKQTTLVVSGTSMGDEHINKIIENALTISSFTMIIFAVGDTLIEGLQQKYIHNKNIIIYEKSCTFKELSDILLSLEGGSQNGQ